MAMAGFLPLLALAVFVLPHTSSAVHSSSSQLLSSEKTHAAGETEQPHVPGAALGGHQTKAGVDAAAKLQVGSQESKYMALFRSLVAGLSTSLGAGIVLLLRGAPTPCQMAFALSLAAGVMITVSVVELLGPPLFQAHAWQAAIAGFFGFVSFLLLRKLVPEPDVASKKDEDVEDASESAKDADSPVDSKHKQWRLAFLMMAALTAHNFPEGLAVGVSSLQSASLGWVVMFAIAVHNIPEGIAIAMPVLEATNSRSKAMIMATLSGLAEPLGALVAVTCLPPDALSGRGMDFLLCAVGGIMTSVACLELVPESLAEKQPLSMVAGLASGTAVMLITHNLA